MIEGNELKMCSRTQRNEDTSQKCTDDGIWEWAPLKKMFCK